MNYLIKWVGKEKRMKPKTFDTKEFLLKFSQPRYLGDGLYATYDGYQINLFTQEGDSVFLEPSVINSFDSYVSEIKNDLNEISS